MRSTYAAAFWGNCSAQVIGIGDQTATFSEFAPIMNRRYAVTCFQQQSDVFSIRRVEGVGHHNEAVALIAPLRGDNAFYLILDVNRCCIHLNTFSFY